jgi:alpha-glucosidase
MRIVNPDGVCCEDTKAPQLAFTASRGERFEVAVLEDDLVRVHVRPQGKARLERTWLVLDRDGSMPRAGRSRDDLSPFSLPAFQVEQQGQTILLTTRSLKLEITLGDFTLRWSAADGTLLAADLEQRAYPYDLGGQQVGHYLRRLSGERYYGFGEVSGELNKAERRLILKNIDALGYNAKSSSPLYKHFPFYITYQPETGQAFGLFYDNLATTTFDLGQEIDNYSQGYRSYTAEGGDVEYYFIYGPSIREVVEKFTRLCGRMLLPPRWSLGYLGSSMKYTDAADAQHQLEKFTELCRQYQIPCDLFHLSSGYTLGEDGKRYVFTWNRKRVPEPRKMVENFHASGIRLAANIKPALLTTHPRFEEVKALGGFIRAADSDSPQLLHFWGGTAGAIDFSNPAAIDWWQRQVKEQLLDLGIDSTWNDNNEYEIWDDAARCDGFGNHLPIGLTRPLQTLWMLRASYEAQLEARPDERPFLISRAGCPGMQRYVQTWSGDNMTSWQTLKYNIPMGLGLGLSGTANTGHDVGGFAGLRPSPELFLRWVQTGIFQPRFTIHSWKIDGSANEPWMYPKMLPYIREAIYFRYRLIPYLYNLLVESAATGQPLMRPLVYQFPHDSQCTDESFDYMLGPSLLVTPVFAPAVRRRKVYLPAGQEWYNFYTQERLEGGETLTASAPLQYIPLFVAAGSLIPMGEVVHPLIHARDDLRQILVFPASASGEASLTLTEDDGHSLAYQHGEVTRLKIDLHTTPRALATEISISPDLYHLPYQELEFILPAGENRPFSLSGADRRWTDNQGRSHITWKIQQRTA